MLAGVKSALQLAGPHKSACPRLHVGQSSSFWLHFDAFMIPSLPAVLGTAVLGGYPSEGH